MTKKIQTSESSNNEVSYEMEKEKTKVQTSEQADKERRRNMTTKKEGIEKVTGEVIIVFKEDDKKYYKKLCKDIDANLKKIEQSFFAIASTLYNIKTKKLYEIDGYKNIYELAKDKFNISRGACNEYIHICTSFGKYDEAAEKYIDLQPKYKEYEHTKLAVMTKLPDELLKDITPKMSVRDIKLIQQEYKNKSSLKEELSENGTSKGEGKKIELLEITDIVNISDTERETLLEKIEKFRQDNPETQYKISVTLTY